MARYIYLLTRDSCFFQSNHQARNWQKKKNSYGERHLKEKVLIHMCLPFPPGCLDIYKCDSCFKIKKEGKCYQHLRECRKTCSGCEGEEISLINTIMHLISKLFLKAVIWSYSFCYCLPLYMSKFQSPNNILIIYKDCFRETI